MRLVIRNYDQWLEDKKYYENRSDMVFWEERTPFAGRTFLVKRGITFDDEEVMKMYQAGLLEE